MNQRTSRNQRHSGQSLVETVLMLPLLLMILLNALNFGYFFLVTINLAAAPRNGLEYGIMGTASPVASAQPTSGPPTGSGSALSVSYQTYQDMTGALWNPTGATIQICSAVNVDPGTKSGLNGTGKNQKANCVTCTNSSSGTLCGGVVTTPTWTPDSEPELNSAKTDPAFVLNRVDVQYTFIPLIPGTPFNIALLASPICTTTGGVTCTFHRYTQMRAMN